MSDQSSGDAVEREREMQEHEREAAERDPEERSGNDASAADARATRDDDDDPTKPAPPGSVPTSGQP
jgi:hypothetical protein